MKKLILVAIIAVLGLSGCNNEETTEYVEQAEVLELTKQVLLECDKPFTFTVASEYNASVTTQTDEEEEVIHEGEFGVEITYVVISECNVCETNETNASIESVVDPTKPVDGNCGCGYELNDCGTLCVETKPIECGEGTVFNEETKTCDAIPPIECDEGFTEREGFCFPNRYRPFYNKETEEFNDCLDGYEWKPKAEICRLGA